MNIVKIILLAGIFLFSQAAFAEQALILKLHYDKGDIQLLDKTIKEGYAPDRHSSSKSGYLLEIISEDGRIIHSFNFLVPDRIYMDEFYSNTTINGGMLKRDRFDFSIVVPYSSEMKELRIYDSSGIKKIDVNKEDLISKRPDSAQILYLEAAVIIFLLGMFYVIKKSKKGKV